MSFGDFAPAGRRPKMPRKTRRQLVGGKLEDLPIEDGRRSREALSRELRRAWRRRKHRA